MSEQTIPILPCGTLQPVLDFYTALGFEVTFRQRSPNRTRSSNSAASSSTSSA